VLIAAGSKRLILKYDEPLSNFAFKFNLRRYNSDSDEESFVVWAEIAAGLGSLTSVGRCRVTLSNSC